MPTQKYSNKQIGIIARYAICRRADGTVYGRTWEQVNRKFSISPSALSEYLQKAVLFGEIAEEERLLRIKATHKKGGFNSYAQKHGKKAASQMCFRAWSKGIGKATPQEIKKWSRKGGKHTHRYNPRVSDNLNFLGDYGIHPCYYKRVEYHSQTERRVASLLLECGLLDRIRPEKNFQRKYGRYTLDFLVETDQGNLGIEIHPAPKKPSGIRQSFADYARERPKKLRREGFEGILVIAKNAIDLFDKLSNKRYAGKYGIPSTFAGYPQKLRAADQKLRDYDLRYGIKPKPKRKRTPRKTVEERRQQEITFRERQKAIQKANDEEEGDALPE